MTKIAIENVNHPGRVERVDAAMYEAMKQAILKVLPASAPGITVGEVQSAVSGPPARGALSGRRQGGMVDEGGPARSRS